MGIVSKNPLAISPADRDNRALTDDVEPELMVGRKTTSDQGPSDRGPRKQRPSKQGQGDSLGSGNTLAGNTPAAPRPTIQGREGVLDPVTAKKRRLFNRTLRKVMRMERELSNAEMAAMFEDDGDLGTAMRRLLLSQE